MEASHKTHRPHIKVGKEKMKKKKKTKKSDKGVNSNMSTHLNKKDPAKTMEGVGLCTNSKKEIPKYAQTIGQQP